MQRYAFVFPGQGSQSVGMGRTLADSSPAARSVMAAADEALGGSISRLAWEGPDEELNRTENAQPALLAVSIAALEALRERRAGLGLPELQPAFAAGHSMGQYSALVASGSLGLADAVRLVRERGRLMQASGKGREGRMAALIGLDEALLPDLLDRAAGSGPLTVANRNAPGQVVISGEAAAIETATAIARELGAKRAIVLPVSVASHSPLMTEAADGMARLLAGIPFGDPHPPIVANGDASLLSTGDAARRELVAHLTAGVDWVRAVESMVAGGVTTFVEIGPGRVLTGLIRRIAPEVDAIATDDPSAAERLDQLAASPTLA